MNGFILSGIITFLLQNCKQVIINSGVIKLVCLQKEKNERLQFRVCLFVVLV